jgi:uroporphyrinogen III methyltransferase/synthase
MSTFQTQPQVSLVGAGPGDPQLITLRGVERVSQADVVLYDYLIDPRVLAHASPDAERICLGRHGAAGREGGRLYSQAEINRLMVDRALAGRRVVRLKGGDPTIFARAADEIAALESAGIEYELVPGITAAQAAACYAGIPMTHGNRASALALVTGQERGGKLESNLDYAALAAFPGTLVFYMGITTARTWTSLLLAAGKPADTPAAIIRRCSWPDQQTITCTLGTVADRIEAVRLRPALIVVVGEVASSGGSLNWFARRPLFGITVMVTRPTIHEDSLAKSLADAGAEVLVQPAIEIGPPPDVDSLDSALPNLGNYDWVVFSSANGVNAVMSRLLSTDRDARAFGSANIAAIGPGTSGALLSYHLRADLVPDTYRAEALVEALAPRASGKRFLLVRASRGREVLAEGLKRAGAHVDQVIAYASNDVASPKPEVAAAMEAGHVDWITVTSSAIARSLAAMFGNQLKQAKLASISPITSNALRACGYPPTAEAQEYTIDGVVRAIVDFETVAERPSGYGRAEE